MTEFGGGEGRAGDRFPCPACGSPTSYQAFSGGREYWCDTCQETGPYPEDGEGLPRATLLRTHEGRSELRQLMREEIARRRGADAEVGRG